MRYPISYYVCAMSINDNINNDAMQLLFRNNYNYEIVLIEYVAYLQTYLLFCI